MPTVETKIWEALKARVSTIDSAYTNATAWPSELFTPPQDNGTKSPYIRVAQVSIAPESVLIESGKKAWRSGTLTVTLVHPLRNQVKFSRYVELASQIAEHFREGTNMRFRDVCVTVTAWPHVADSYEDAGYINIPVIIPWRTFA